MVAFQLKREWISLFALVSMILLSVALYPSLPDVVPIHWDISGQPDGFAPKLQGAVLVPVGAVILYAILFFAPLLDPKRASLERSADTYLLLRTFVMLFFLFVHALSLIGSLQERQTVSTSWITAGAGLLFIVLGNYMPRLKPSWIAGIRTPWTLSSDRVWIKTHRVGGRLFVTAGLLVFASIFLPGGMRTATLGAAVALALVAPIVYSYWVWRQDSGA